MGVKGLKTYIESNPNLTRNTHFSSKHPNQSSRNIIVSDGTPFDHLIGRNLFLDTKDVVHTS